MINSISNITQLYAPRKVNKTTAISAYGDISSAKPQSRMEQMQEKYKDVYAPIPPTYSKEIEDLQVQTIREKYPDYLPLEQALEKYAVKIDMQNPQSKEELEILQKEKTTQIVQNQGEDHYTMGTTDPNREAYIKEVINKYPNNLWDRPGISVSNSKELANFYNAGVYEGLESGKSLEEAKTISGHAVRSFMDMSDYYNNTIMKSTSHLAGKTIECANNNDKQVNYNNRIDLREYGFDMEVGTINIYNNEQQMTKFIQNKLDYYNFIIENKDIVKEKYDNLDFKTNNVSSYDQIIKPIQERYKPEAELALSIFSKYKIFNSIDIKA